MEEGLLAQLRLLSELLCATPSTVWARQLEWNLDQELKTTQQLQPSLQGSRRTGPLISSQECQDRAWDQWMNDEPEHIIVAM